jgi:hypothetical protein
MVRVPEMGESGLVYVHVNGGRSNGVLFTSSAAVPRPVEGEELGLGPRIASITPQTGAAGTLLTITGNNFGGSREGGGVFFSWDYTSSLNPHIVKEQEYIEVSEIELGYLSWNSREIRVRLPAGAISGNMEVRTPHGISRPFYFEVTGRPGTKTFADKRSYTVNYSVDIRVLEATRPNNLYLWVPMPVNSPSQRNVSIVSRNAYPFIENHRGVSLFKLDNLATGTILSVSHSFSVDVYSVETRINPQTVRRETSPLSALHTQSSELIPGDNQLIRETVNTIIGREQNPYNRAKLIYDWIITNIEINDTFSGSVVSAIEQRQSDSYTTTLLYTTMARAAGIPCIPVAGVLIDRNRWTLNHYWAEFWIDDFGWVPVDPVMGAGAISGNFAEREDPAAYYFGNMDNQRIAFSRGELLLSQMGSRGRMVSRHQSYSLQNIWEEASGGLESYTSLWGDIIISGIYIQ